MTSPFVFENIDGVTREREIEIETEGGGERSKEMD